MKESEFLMKEVESLIKEAEQIAKKYNIDIDEKKIGNTNYDMYRWTFDKCIFSRTREYRFIIPDGFKSVFLDDDCDGVERFMIIPENCRGIEDFFNRDVVLFNACIIKLQDYEYYHHVNARAGMAGELVFKSANEMQKKFNIKCRVYSYGTNDGMANILTFKKETGITSYMMEVYVGSRMFGFSLDTLSVSEVQQKDLCESLFMWIRMITPFSTKSCVPTSSKMEDEKCYVEIKEKGALELFSKGVREAVEEYNIAYEGKMKLLALMAENGIVEKRVDEDVKEILKEAMKVKEYYYSIANKLIEKLIKDGVSILIIKKMIKILHDLDEDILSSHVDGKEIKISVPLEIEKIRKNLNKLELVDEKEYVEKKKIQNVKSTLRNVKGKITRSKNKLKKMELDISKYEKELVDYIKNLDVDETVYIDSMEKLIDDIKIISEKIDNEEKEKNRIEENISQQRKDSDIEKNNLLNKLKNDAINYEIYNDLAKKYKKEYKKTLFGRNKIKKLYIAYQKDADDNKNILEKLLEQYNKHDECIEKKIEDLNCRKSNITNSLGTHNIEFNEKKKEYNRTFKPYKQLSDKLVDMNTEYTSLKQKITNLEKEKENLEKIINEFEK